MISAKDLFVREIRINVPLPKREYYSAIPAVKAIKKNPLVFDKRVTIFCGENAIGKSTILEALAIAVGFNPEGGTKNYSFSTRDSHSSLHELLTVVRGDYSSYGYFLRAESFYNVASEEERIASTPGFDNYIPKEYHKKSHGEAFLALAKGFRHKGLYILDEPEAALSPSRLMSLMCIIHELESDSQFIIATHSPILMAYPGARIFKLDENGIESVGFRETEHYQVTRQFMADPDGMFKVLFGEYAD